MGYHQIELDEKSRIITTFVTHRGLYRYKRLVFGIYSASEIYQHLIQQVLQGCEGVRNISDDIVIYGKNHKEHNMCLEKVLQRLQDKGCQTRTAPNPDSGRNIIRDERCTHH